MTDRSLGLGKHIKGEGQPWGATRPPRADLRVVPGADDVPAPPVGGAEATNAVTARSRVVGALLDLQAAVPLTSALLTIRRRPAGPELPVFAYGERPGRAAEQRDVSASAPLPQDSAPGASRECHAVSCVFTHDGRAVGALRVVVSGELDDDALAAVEQARVVLEEEVVAFVLAGDAGLTDRELDVLRAMATGATNREIAVELHLSLSTVKTHVERILGKLDAANRIQAVRRATRTGLA